MRHPDTVYRGERLSGPRGLVLGARVTVNGRPLDPRPSWKLRNHSPGGFEWGYRGSGPAQLALALVLDSTGSRERARLYYQRFKAAVVADWGDRWEITAAEVLRWLEQFEREQPVMGCSTVRRCRVCSCSDSDCRQCIAATGYPCSWVEGEADLCTRCAEDLDRALIVEMEGGAA